MIKLFFKNRFTAGLLLVAAMAPSCKKLIGIPSNPPTAITEAQQFADSATAMTAIAGVYNYTSFNSSGFMYNDAYLTECTGLSADELSYDGYPTPALQQFYNYGLNDQNNYVNTIWGDPYTGLYVANDIMTNMAVSKALSASFKDRIIAEMKVIRAFYYFNTVNLFGNIPLVLSIDYNANARLPRASVDSIYGQILTDLSDAEKVLTADYPSAGRIRVNLYTALTLQAKVQLYRKQWQAAYDAAGAVINSGMYTLEPDPNNVFLDGSSEAIWQLPAIGPNNVTQEASVFIPYSNSVPQYLVTPFLQNAFEAGDLRWQDWVQDYTVNVNGTDQHFFAPYKYKNLNATFPTVEDYMIFRLADVLLIHAEAAAHLGKTTEALADLDLVRARAGLAPSTAATADEILAAVMHERQVELFCEWGNRWFDLKRTGTAATVLGAEKAGWKDYQALYPIPRSQRQFNSTLTPNPGY
ncbi:MAG TPA: RagB/SusD family nutrient uptake outer membrane protein [Puia sp.]|jgi:hypothetical protein